LNFERLRQAQTTNSLSKRQIAFQRRRTQKSFMIYVIPSSAAEIGEGEINFSCFITRGNEQSSGR
jgi:hypothetical protein